MRKLLNLPFAHLRLKELILVSKLDVAQIILKIG